MYGTSPASRLSLGSLPFQGITALLVQCFLARRVYWRTFLPFAVRANHSGPLVSDKNLLATSSVVG